MAERRTRLGIILDRAKFSGIKSYYTTNWKKPFITVRGISFQFKDRKHAADFVDHLDSIITYKRYGRKPTRYVVEGCRDAAKYIISITKE